MEASWFEQVNFSPLASRGTLAHPTSMLGIMFQAPLGAWMLQKFLMLQIDETEFKEMPENRPITIKLCR